VFYKTKVNDLSILYLHSRVALFPNVCYNRGMNDAKMWLQDADLVFNTYSQYLKRLYKVPVYRVSVDAGFSCPNRSADRLQGGCLYCDASGARAPYLGDTTDIKQQIEGAIAFLKKRYKAQQFILYFQAFSNTYAPAAQLKTIYDYALTLAPFRELIISTRPDCITAEIADLISSYRTQGVTPWVELGLQSSHNKTLALINRGHTVGDFFTAYRLLKEKGIKVTVHLIFGLPGEGEAEILETVRLVAALEPDGIKLHNLHLVKGTVLYDDYLKGEIVVPTFQQHLETVLKALELLPTQTVVMRLTCDTPVSLLVSPRRFPDKAAFYRALRDAMLEQQTRQGRCYG